jgi:site-specific recombinase XerD
MRYFGEFLGEKQDIQEITADDLRRFIIALQRTPKFRHHPFNRPQEAKLSPQSIETYARAIRAFFGYLYREELIPKNPMQRVKMPKVPMKVVPTFSAVEIEKLLSIPDKSYGTGFRNYALMLTFVDTAARLSEIAMLRQEDIDLDNGYLRVMGKGEKERYIPIGHKVSKALLKYKLKFRPEPVGTDAFWLSVDGSALTKERIEKIVANCGKIAGLKRCYPHKLRHTSSVLYLRNGGDPFSLQKKLGHSSLQMTRHYSNLADSDVKAMHMKYGVADKLNV